MLSDVSFDLWSVLLAFGVFQGFFLLPLILRTRNAARIFLSALVLIILLNLTNYLFLSSNLYRHLPQFVFLPNPLLFLVGPLYYFYIRTLLSRNFHFQWRRHWPHFLPLLIGVFFHWDFLIMGPSSKIAFLDGYFAMETLQASWWVTAYASIHIFQSLVYILLAGKVLNKARNELSGTKRVHEFRWLKRFNVIFAGYWCIDFFGILWLTLANGFFHAVDYIVMLSGATMIHLLAFMALGKNKVFNEVFLAGQNGKYERSGLKAQKSMLLLNKLDEIMHQEQPYLDADLKLSMLAQKMDVSANTLSQLLNEQHGKNFYQFVNTYRLEAVKQKLADPTFANYTILGIAMDCGFNNKNTFNRYFKSETGLTPSAYLKSLA